MRCCRDQRRVQPGTGAFHEIWSLIALLTLAILTITSILPQWTAPSHPNRKHTRLPQRPPHTRAACSPQSPDHLPQTHPLPSRQPARRSPDDPASHPTRNETPLRQPHPPENARCNASAPIASPVSSMPWPSRGTYTASTGTFAARNAASASRERCTGTTSSASPCTSSTGARLASSAARRLGRDQRAGERQDRARRDGAAQAGEQHGHRALAEAHQRVGLRRQTQAAPVPRR